MVDRVYQCVSIENFSPDDVDLRVRTLSYSKHKQQKIYGNIRTGETKKNKRFYRARSDTGVGASNDRGSIMLVRKDGGVLGRVSYSSSRTEEIVAVDHICS